MSARRFAPLLVAAALVAASNARAQERASVAAQLFEAAAAASIRGDHAAAATAFEQAYRLGPRGATIFNAALSWEAAGKLERAADAYAHALAHTDLAADARERAEQRLTEYRPELGLLVIEAAPGLTFDIAHVTSAKAPVEVHVVPGSYKVVIRDAEGVLAERDVTLAKGERLGLDLRGKLAPRVREAPRAPAPKPAESAVSTETAGYVVLGTSALAAGAAIYLGLSALAARDEFVESGETNADAHDRADRLRTFTNVAWIGAGVLAVTGGVLVLVSPSSSSTAGHGFHGVVAGSF
jgi:tetratricopeptide (TPR) repeat protein